MNWWARRAAPTVRSRLLPGGMENRRPHIAVLPGVAYSKGNSTPWAQVCFFQWEQCFFLPEESGRSMRERSEVSCRGGPLWPPVGVGGGKNEEPIIESNSGRPQGPNP